MADRTGVRGSQFIWLDHERKLVQVGWQLCKDGTLWSVDSPDHAGRCPECKPVYIIESEA